MTRKTKLTEQERVIAVNDVDESKIDPDAIKIIERLKKHHYRACICGGSVRDLLLGRKPKDFDIATDAHPRRIRRIFSNSRVIGRRFQLVHVYFPPDKIIEVATFRRQNEFAETSGCLINCDNTFGTPREDARRRDFTVNGLFYDIFEHKVVDYVGGLEDLRRGVISSIGDPFVRFREDPVRMIRAIRFAARLDMGIEQMSLDAIRSIRNDLRQCSTARLIEEVLRLLRQTAVHRSLELLYELGLMEVVLPNLYAILSEQKNKKCSALFWNRLKAMDEYHSKYPIMSDALLFALLYSPFIERYNESKEGLDYKAVSEIFHQVNASPVSNALARAHKGRIIEIISAYRTLSKPGADIERQLQKLRDRKYFAEAFVFFKLESFIRGNISELDIPEQIALSAAYKPPSVVWHGALKRTVVLERSYRRRDGERVIEKILQKNDLPLEQPLSDYPSDLPPPHKVKHMDD